MSQFQVEPAQLRAYAQYMRELADSFDDITRFVRGEGGNVSGFVGLLAVLTPAVEIVSDAVCTALGVGLDRLSSSADGLERAALGYEATDAANAARSDAIVMPDIPDPVGSA